MSLCSVFLTPVAWCIDTELNFLASLIGDGGVSQEAASAATKMSMNLFDGDGVPYATLYACHTERLGLQLFARYCLRFVVVLRGWLCSSV